MQFYGRKLTSVVAIKTAGHGSLLPHWSFKSGKSLRHSMIRALNRLYWTRHQSIFLSKMNQLIKVAMAVTNISGRGTVTLPKDVPQSCHKLEPVRTWSIEICWTRRSLIPPPVSLNAIYDINKKEIFLHNAAARVINNEFGTSSTVLKLDNTLTIPINAQCHWCHHGFL